MSTPERSAPRRRRGPDGPIRVASGILLSRATGLVREIAVAAVFGLGGHADVLAAAFRGPNLLQNLLGEQTLSASVIPVYGRLLESGRREEAGRFAGAVFGFLLAVAAAATLAGVLLARPLAAIFTPGFLGDAARIAAGEPGIDRFELLVRALRFVFPMAGVLVLAAWTLAVLNTHRKFFLPYMAPALWNSTILAALLGGGALLVPGGLGGLGDAVPPDTASRLVILTCAGALVGGLLQFGLQLPPALRAMPGFRVRLDPAAPGLDRARRAFGPMLMARGANQLSSYLDQVLASLLAAGAIAALRWAGLLYLLPFSLFAASVAAAELPELARGAPSAGETARRARRALARTGFLILPTSLGYLLFGWILVGAVYGRGQFELSDRWLVYLVLAAYCLGLPAGSWSRLLQNVFYAAGDTGTPARLAFVRLSVSAAVGASLMFPLDRLAVAELVSVPAGDRTLFLGACGLALAAAVAAWLELALLLRAVRRRLPGFRLPGGRALAALAIAALAAAGGWGVSVATRGAPDLARGAAVVLGYAGLYLLIARSTRSPELAAWLGRFGGASREDG